VKTYIHARLTRSERARLEELKAATGRSESELVRVGLRLAADQLGHVSSARDLAGTSVGRFTRGPRDLSTNRRHLDDFGG